MPAKKKKLLILEDEAILGQMYQERFEKEGFIVFLATSTALGLEIAQKEKPDFILLDILLTDNNGIYFLQEKSKKPEIAAIPVMAFSNYDDPETKNKAFSFGVRDYLLKTSYTPQEVVERVKRYL
jgi:DNA-binding response OmpR family regulator